MIVDSKTFSHTEIDNIADFTKRLNFDAVVYSDTSSGLDIKALLPARDFKIVALAGDTKLPLRIQYATPETLGKDRIAAAVGAFKRFKGSEKHSLIVDMGSCITMDVISPDGVFMGGNISPGLRMRLTAMHDYTGKLPFADVHIPEILIGNSTITALQNGGIKGAFYEIEGFIRSLKGEFGKINVILTGGDAVLFAKFSKNKIFVLPNLVLEGLNEILIYNASKI